MAEQATTPRRLEGNVALVAGATRGAGRAIALALGAAGATVYCTGRSVRGNPSEIGRRETVDDTADQINAAGGSGIAMRVDHTQEAEVIALFERISAEQGGRLDILVNDVWGGEHLIEFKPFWETSIQNGLKMFQTGLFTHLITARYGAPLMIARGQGLIIEVTDGDTPDYRGMLYYDLVKSGVIRHALGLSEELRPHGITAVALTPGFLRSEQLLDHFDLAGDEVRGPGVDRVVLDVQGAAVAPEAGGDALGDVDRAARCRRLVHDAVVDVGVVDDRDDGEVAVLEVAPEDVPETVGAGVADVHRAVDGEAAGVDADHVRLSRDEVLLTAAERVVNLERHRVLRPASFPGGPG